MKLQGFSVIFTLVCIPLLLVLSYYISLQVDTITLQNQYDTKLLDATYDAMSSFELNTANEDLSSVSDSLRTIIEASNSIFFNTLATNMGMSNASKIYIEPYIPSVLYTLYDGYYIFAPTSVPVVATSYNGVAISAGDDGVKRRSDGYYDYSGERVDGGGYKTTPASGSFDDFVDPNDYGQLLYMSEGTVEKPSKHSTYERIAGGSGNQVNYDYKELEKLTPNISEAKKEVKNVLKSYMPYSARYKGDNFDITVVYTLDNHINVEGYKWTDGDKRVYYSESGYLLNGVDPDNSGVEVKIGSDNILNGDTSRYSQNEMQSIIDYNRASVYVTIKDTRSETAHTVDFDTSTLLSIESIIGPKDDIDDFGHCDLYDVNADFKNNKEVLNELLYHSDRWDEKSLKEQYETIITVINNKTKEVEAQLASLDKAAANYETDSALLLGTLNGLNRFKNMVQEQLDLMSAVSYYSKALIFTNWVITHLQDIKANDIIEISGLEYGTIQEGLEGTSESGNKDFENLMNFHDDNSLIFAATSFEGEKKIGETENEDRLKLNDDSVTEISKESIFYNHKLRVIRASIQYSLNLSMSVYNSTDSYGFIAQSEVRRGTNVKDTAYAMPVISYDEWEKITDNPSIVAFMQGMRCGLKVYNNYAIVSSTNNEIIVHPEQIYYVPYGNNYEEFNIGGNLLADKFYHRIDCAKLLSEVGSAYGVKAFSSKEVKYDKIYDKTAPKSRAYKYDHKNLACYDCVNDGNYIGEDNYVNIFTSSKANVDKLRKAFYKGVGKERNDVYKMNAFAKSEGYQKIYEKGSTITNAVNSTYALKEIQGIRIVFDHVSGQGDTVLNFRVYNGSTRLNDNIFSIPADSSERYTIDVRLKDFSDDSSNKLNAANLKFSIYDGDGNEYINPADQVNKDKISGLKNGIKCVEVTYK